MNDEERRRRRLDRVMAEMNRRDAAMHAALQVPPLDDEPAEPDEQDPPTPRSTK